MKTLPELETVESKVAAAVEAALETGNGLLRLAPCWVPRDFLQPGYRMKLDPRDIYAFGAERGGIDERWFSSTIEAANPGRTPDEGLSYCVFGNERFLLRDAVAECGATLIGESLWERYERWPVFAKFFDNMGPIPLHMHQNEEQAALVGEQGKPESYYFPPQVNQQTNAFPHSFFGLEPDTTKEQIKACLERWDQGDNGILDLSRAYRLEPGTGWLVEPGLLHAPGSLCTFEPQWASDVTAMFQNFVEERFIEWDMLVTNIPKEKARDLDFIVNQLNWEANTDPDFKANRHLKPVLVADTKSEGYEDRWVVYGKIQGEQLFTAKELTVFPGAKCRIKDAGAYGIICVQGYGSINGQPLASPTMIRFGELTEDEYFCSHTAAREGVVFENKSSSEPLVCLRYFGPDANPDAPDRASGLL